MKKENVYHILRAHALAHQLTEVLRGIDDGGETGKDLRAINDARAAAALVFNITHDVLDLRERELSAMPDLDDCIYSYHLHLVEILADTAGRDLESGDLEHVHSMIYAGPYCGVHGRAFQRQIPANLAAAGLYEFGCEPLFFRLDDEGREID
jgi:hypothetical protein